VNQPREEARHGNQQQTQEVENASVALAAGMHFAGDIAGFRVDTDASESFGGPDVGSSTCVSCCSGGQGAQR